MRKNMIALCNKWSGWIGAIFESYSLNASPERYNRLGYSDMPRVAIGYMQKLEISDQCLWGKAD